MRSNLLSCLLYLSGFLGDLTINIPWSDLKGKPVQIFINNVYLLATPKVDSDFDLELEEERAHKVKMDKIEASELLESGKGKLSGEFMDILGEKASILNASNHSLT